MVVPLKSSLQCHHRRGEFHMLVKLILERASTSMIAG
jgi:hypothetical protein